MAALAQQEPQVLAFVTHEALLAGGPARTRHDQLFARLERAVEDAWEHAPQDEPAPDVPARVLLGGSARLYCMQARRGEPPQHGLATSTAGLDRLLHHTARTARPPQVAEQPAGVHVGGSREREPAHSPRSLPRGRHRLARDIVEAIQRERIAYAAAEVLAERDGHAIAVADIVATAGVSREVFYAHFADKEQAFHAAHQLVFEQLIGACGSAFFTPGTCWPERVWDTGRAAAALLAVNPSFAHFAFVSAYATGEPGVRRVDEAALAFKLFLEEGQRLRANAALPRAATDALALGVAEIAAHHVRAGRTSELPALIPAVAYTALAPFIGCDAAGELVDRMRAKER